MNTTESAKRNTQIARSYIERVFNQHKPELVARFVTPDVAWHGGTLATVRGADTLTGLLTSFIGALPDVQWDAVDIVRIDEAGRIAEEWAADDLAAVASQLGAIDLPWAG